MFAVNKCIQFVQTLLWPATCVLCGGPGHGGRDLCRACARDLPWLPAGCRCCARPLAPPAQVCGDCLRHPPPFQCTLAPLRYHTPVDRLVQRLKFHGRLHYARLLGELIADRVQISAQGPMPEVLVPVPLHPARQRQRGFNQATELARPVARRFGIPVAWSGCQRQRATDSQSLLDRRARRTNLRDAFAVQRCPARYVAVIDDVVTTGSTVRALAQALRRSGVERVDVWCAARAELD